MNQDLPDLLTAAQMRPLERGAIDRGEVTGLELMERAGEGVVAAILEEWPGLEGMAGPERGASPPHPPEYFANDESGRGRRAVVLCGPGNNGGDGFVIARLLRERGWAVEVFLFGNAKALPPDARANFARWQGAVGTLSGQGGEKEVLPDCDVLVDALFGTGLSRPVGLRLPDLCAGAGHVVAVDVPSGLCSDAGRCLGRDGNVVRADLTVSFHREKIGHRLGEGPRVCGAVRVVDIGLREVTASDRVQLVGQPAGLGKSGTGHKFSHGHALVLSGPAGAGGAARLAARGALRIGAGLVTIGCPRVAMAENAAQLTAIMLTQVDEAADMGRWFGDPRLSALCLGPGLGVARARDLVEAVLGADRKRPVVLDADALSAFADEPEDLFTRLHPGCVLTPHGGEFARLFPDIAARLAAPALTGPAFSKADAVREIAARAGCTVLFKGHDTVIADETGACWINSADFERAAPWLATAGSGDVLAGFITGLLARGFAPLQAARDAAWLHVECARAFGPGLIAEDLPEALPGVLARILPDAT